jgi:GTP-binding protein
LSTPVVAIIGRPNVGKSELFNRIIGEPTAIVSEEAGTTRDRNFARAEWGGRSFWLVDTGGLNDDPSAQMDVEIRKQVDAAMGEADLLLFIVDAKSGIHPVDYHVADLLRSSGRPWVLVANKVDDPRDPAFYEFFNMGLGDPFPVSALNGKGSGDLLDRIVEMLPDGAAETEEAIRVAVIGKPNVGKSSFVNRLLGEDRLVVSDVPGTTRDSIDTPMKYHGTNLVFIDTAGLRRQSRLEDGVEFYSSLRTRKAIERSDICILMLDATEGEIQNQDLKIATLAWESGRALIMIVNKWDIAEKDDKAAAKYEKAAVDKAPYLGFVPFLFTSAKTGQRVTKVLDIILKVNEERHKRVPTAQINARLAELIARRQPPQAAGRDVRLNYATQVETAPPSIAVFGNAPDLVAEHYIRFLHNGFRETYPFDGNPLRILMRRKS